MPEISCETWETLGSADKQINLSLQIPSTSGVNMHISVFFFIR